MPKVSGLFAYANKHVNPTKFNKVSRVVIINEDHEVKPTALILFLAGAVTAVDTFARRGYAFGPRAHLRIDQEYYSSRSPVPGRQNLSYCHGTEYFINVNDKIEVHYYFDRWGSFTHARCTLYKKSASGELISSELFEPDLAEVKSIRERARQYGDLIRELIEDKKSKYLKLAEQIEGLYASLMQYVKTTSVEQSVLEQKLTQIKELIKSKNELDDDGQDVSFRFFQSCLSNIQAEQERVVKVAEQEVEAVSSVATVAHSSPTKAKRKPRPKDVKKSTKAEMAQKLAEFEKDLSKFEDTKDSLETPEYLKALDQLLEQLIFLYLGEDLDAKLQKRAQECWARVEKLPDAMALFNQALLDGNLVKIQELFPYCKDLVSPKMYDDAAFEWFRGASDEALVKKREAVFDFLHENCSVFNYFVQNKAAIFYPRPGNPDELRNFMYLIYLSMNKTIFSALLRYGINPFVPWLKSTDGTYHRAMRVLTELPINTDFYVKELLRYGVSLDGEGEPYSRLTTTVDAAKLGKLLNKADRRELDTRLSAANEVLSKFGAESIPVETATNGNGVATSKATLPFTPLSELCLTKETFYHYPELFGVLVEKCDLSQKLVALAVIYNSIVHGSGVASRSRASDVVVCSADQFVTKLTAYSGQDGNRITVVFGLDKNSFSAPIYRDVVTITKNLLSAIRGNIKGMSPAKIEEVKLDLEKHASLATAEKNYKAAAQHYVAIIMLYAYCKSLNEEEYIKFIKYLSRAAFLFANAGNALAKVPASAPRDPAAKREYDLLVNEHSLLRGLACKYYLVVISTIFSDPTGKLIEHELLKKSLDAIKDILDGKMLSPAMYAEIRSVYDVYIAAYNEVRPTNKEKLKKGPGF